MGFLKCKACDHELYEDDLILDRKVSAILQPMRIVTTGYCPACQTPLNGIWELRDIEVAVND